MHNSCRVAPRPDQLIQGHKLRYSRKARRSLDRPSWGDLKGMQCKQNFQYLQNMFPFRNQDTLTHLSSNKFQRHNASTVKTVLA